VAREIRPSELCFACGSENPRGLGLRFRLEDGRALAEFMPHADHQGYPGLIHGGVVAAVLDEAMGWACYGAGLWAMTARFTLRFRRPVRLDEPVTVAGWVARDRGRFVETKAELRSAAGKLLAHADGLFVRVSGERAEELRRLYEGSTA
jgi:acyl-coenzyme A thioesterase PaaI-like protein